MGSTQKSEESVRLPDSDDSEADARSEYPLSIHPGLVVYRPIRMDHTANNAPHPAPEAEEVYRRWIQFLDEEFTRHQAPERRAEIVRDQLTQLYLGRPHGGKLNLTLTSELPGNVLSLSLDPENVTLEAEHFADAAPEQFAKRKPLLWFWQMFDRSPIGTNHWLGLRFRSMLGRHIFARIGAGVKIYHGVDLTYGYNLAIEEGVTIRQRALLNDRGGITIGKGAVIGSFARIYSHSHAAHDFGGQLPGGAGVKQESRIRDQGSGKSSPDPADSFCLRSASLRRAHSAMHHKPVEVIVQELTMLFAIRGVVLRDAAICAADQNPAIQHARIVQLDQVAQVIVQLLRCDLLLLDVGGYHGQRRIFFLQ